jgi:hypothetical protein
MANPQDDPPSPWQQAAGQPSPGGSAVGSAAEGAASGSSISSDQHSGATGSSNPLSYPQVTDGGYGGDSGGEVGPLQPPSQRQLATALGELPGSPIALAYQRAGLPIPRATQPSELDEEQWAAQGYEVRGILGHAEHEGKLYVRIAWEDSWQWAGGLVGEALDAYQARLTAGGDSTDVVGRAQRELSAAEQRERAEQQQQQRGSRSSSRRAAAPAATA